MDATQLITFGVVARTGHITAAAAELGVTQPAVSKAVKQLERTLGTKLIERAGRGIVLTAAGRELAGHARRVGEALADAERAMADLSSLRRGRLRVGASPAIGLYLLPPLLVRYRLKYPGVDLGVEIEQASALYRRLADEQLDLALSEVEPTVDRFAARAFMHDTYHAILPAKHTLAKHGAVTPQQLAGAGLITRRSDAAGGSFVGRTLRLTTPGTLQLDSTESIKQAVAAGLGVAIVSGLAVASPDPRLAVRPLKGASLRRPLFAVRPRGGAESKALTAFLQMLKHAARGSLPPLDRPVTAVK